MLLSLLAAPAFASLSEAETSYTGAIMLEGKVDAEFDKVLPGPMHRDGKYTQTEYAFWSGNTLYVGAEDEHGNQVDGIVEFFWFESSIDRGSDFYVAVIKARTTPNVKDDWFLMDDNDKPVLYVDAYTDITRQTSGFRWDWSLPFDNYGMDSYGQVTMKSSYGIGGGAEGSAMAAKKVTDEATGATAEIEVQSKGYANSEYSVNTEYTVNLWSWYTWVSGSPSNIEWATTLDNKTKLEENAYAEYFLVMQAEEGEEFIIDELHIGATTDEWWWGKWNEYSVTVEGLRLTRPAYEVEDEEEEEEEEELDSGLFDDSGYDSGIGLDGTFDDDPTAGGGAVPLFDDPEQGGCSSTGTGAGFAGLLGGLGLMLLRRRD